MVQEGDRNTAYFQVVANKRRKKIISELEGPQGLVFETEDIHEVAVNYYKDLFGNPELGLI